MDKTEDEGDDHEDGDGSEDAQADLGDLLASPVVDEALDDVERTGEDCVDGEEDVVGLDGNNPPRMSAEVLILENKSDMDVLILEDKSDKSDKYRYDRNRGVIKTEFQTTGKCFNAISLTQKRL